MKRDPGNPTFFYPNRFRVKAINHASQGVTIDVFDHYFTLFLFLHWTRKKSTEIIGRRGQNQTMCGNPAFKNECKFMKTNKD